MTKDGKQDSAFGALITIINRAERSEKNALAALLRGGYEKRDAAAAIEKAKEYGYLSDEKFSERYVYFQKSAKGKYRIAQELKQKGIEETVIVAALAEYTDSAETCESVAIRYMHNKVWEPKTAQKLLQYLVRRGFSYEESRRAAGAVRASTSVESEFEIPCE